MRPRFIEEGRQLAHMGAGMFALLLRYISWWQALILASVAVAFNLYALPRLAGSLYRPAEGQRRRRYCSGVALYPIAVVLLILVFPDRLDIVAAAWGNSGGRGRHGDDRRAASRRSENPVES